MPEAGEQKLECVDFDLFQLRNNHEMCESVGFTAAKTFARA